MNDDSVATAASFTIGACVIAIIVAIAKPDVAHLVVQAVFVIALALVAVIGAAAVLGPLPKGPFATGWRPVRKVRPPLPREMTALVTDLDVRSRRLPPTAVAKVANLMTQRLELRHGLSPDRDGDIAALERLLSPAAFTLVTARRRITVGRTHPYELVDRRLFDPLMHELEQL